MSRTDDATPSGGRPDMVFGDGYPLQLATVTGNVSDGMTATLKVPV